MKSKKHSLLIGAHMSIAGGLYKAIERGQSIGCTVIQLFTKSNRQWQAKYLTPTDIQKFKKSAENSNVTTIVAHATYLINLGSPDSNVENKSIDAISIELSRCEQLGIPYLVLHPGSCLNTDEASCLKKIAHNLDIALERTPGTVKILLETMAGQGSSMCYSFEHIATIIKESLHKERIGVCLDTCHIFAAGYDLRTPQTYENMWQEFDKIIGLNQLKVIHVNDSKKSLGSRVDRHENIGSGKIGLEAFRLLFNDKRFFDIPKIIETPKDSLEEDMRNINIIKELLSTETKKILN